MNLSRRQCLRSAVCALASPVLSRSAFAQPYPSRPVRLVVGFAPGSTNDILARLISQWLSERLGQPFVVENRPGGGGNVAAEMVARGPADGYSLLMVSTSAAINATLHDKLNFNVIRDFAAVASIVRQPHILLVNPSVSAKAVPELIAYAKANPGRINMASSGTGTGPHVVGELFKAMAGIDIVHVPYRGGAPALSDLLAGQVQMMFPAPAASIEHIRQGLLRPLAVTTATRWEPMQEIPTIGEFIPGYEASTWFGICAPKQTPVDIIERLNKEINAGLADPKMKARLADLGGGIFVSSPQEFGTFLADETKKWARVVRAAKITVQ